MLLRESQDSSMNLSRCPDRAVMSNEWLPIYYDVKIMINNSKNIKNNCSIVAAESGPVLDSRLRNRH